MEVKSCRRCKRLFNYLVGPYLCPKCKEELEEKFQEVKKYVQENPTCNINQVARECDVEINQLTLWIREDRLQFSEASGSMVGCERCGVAIKSGRFCDECKVAMTKSFNQAIASKKPESKPEDKSSGARMRYFDK